VTRLASSARSALGRVDPVLWGILSVFLALTLPRLGAVPMWDSRIYYDRCLMDPLEGHFDLLALNCFGHPSMLYMILFVPGQLLSFGSAVLLNLTSVLLGLLAIGAFWVLTTVFLPGTGRRTERLLATGLFAVWPASIACCLSMTPDYGVLVFSLLYLALLLTNRIELAALAGLFLVFSKEFGVLLYGLATALFLTIRFASGSGTLSQRLREAFGKWVLIAPALLYFSVSAYTLLTRPTEAAWGGKASAASALTRFVRFNPAELFFGRYGPLIWVLSFSWVLTGLLLVAALRLAASSRARATLRSLSVSKSALLFLVFFFAAAVFALTRYETYANVRYLLPLAPLLILVSVVSLEIALPSSAARRATLGVVFVLLAASNFRTLDPVSRIVWGTFPFGRHRLLQMASWSNECCGYARDQLVYNLEYLKFHDLQNAMFRDIRPDRRTIFVANTFADWFLGGRVTPDGARTLRLPDTVRVHYASPTSLDKRRSPPETAYFVAFPNFDNNEGLRTLRRSYQVVSHKTYEQSGYAITVYAVRRKHPTSTPLSF
jgi:hypothetical protein